MSVHLVLVIVGLVLALVAEVQAQGRNILAWGVIALALALLPLTALA